MYALRETRRSVTSGVVLAAFAGSAMLLAFPAAATTVNEPIILRVSVSGDTLTIQGTSLGINRPTIQLGGEPLAVTSFSPTQVVATMPSTGLPPGTYQLLFARANGATATFAVSLPAVPCRGRPGGTCSTTTTLSCAYDKDCPTGERCRDPSPRFAHGNGTVTDLRTCLMWEKKTGTPRSYAAAAHCTSASVCPDPHDVNNLYLWGTVSSDVATVFLKQLNDAAFAGHTDWRLPTSAGGGAHPTGEDPELESILLAPHPCVTSPCIDTTVFGPTFADFYWSSSPSASFPGPAWYVSFSTGDVGVADYSYDNFARAVRRVP